MDNNKNYFIINNNNNKSIFFYMIIKGVTKLVIKLLTIHTFYIINTSLIY